MTVAPAVLDDQVPVGEGLVPNPEEALVTAYQLLRKLEQDGGATETALTLSGQDWGTYCAFGYMIGRVTRTSAFYGGDVMLTVQREYPEEFSQFTGVFGLTPQTMLARMFVCENVPPERRMEGVPFSIHALVARLPAKEQSKWLRLAKEKGLTCEEMRDRMRASRKDTKPQLPDTQSHDPDPDLLVEVADEILRSAEPAPDDLHFLISRELIARLRGAMGRE